MRVNRYIVSIIKNIDNWFSWRMNSTSVHATLAIGVVWLIDDMRGDTNTELRVGRGERALVGTGRLGIEKGCCRLAIKILMRYYSEK